MKSSKLPLKLKRPLAVFDLETTGLIIGHDRIVEIAVLRIRPDGTRTKYQSLVNPEMRIPREATRIHGITNRDVRRAPKFRLVAKKLIRMLKHCDLAGFNINRFDLLILQEEFRRAEVEFSCDGRAVIDACRIYHVNEPRNLAAAYRFYCDGDHRGAHSASEDVRVCWKVLLAQLTQYEHVPRAVRALHDYCNPVNQRYVDSTGKFEWRDGKAVFLFGQNKGETLNRIAEERPGDLEWMLQKDFEDDVKEIVRNALRGRFPRQRAKH